MMIFAYKGAHGRISVKIVLVVVVIIIDAAIIIIVSITRAARLLPFWHICEWRQLLTMIQLPIAVNFN